MAWWSVKKHRVNINFNFNFNFTFIFTLLYFTLLLPLPLFHYRVQTGSGAHPASYLMSIGGSFPGGKADEAWNWPLTSI
jgi:hypothetical protein